VDNGPEGLVQQTNDRLYDVAGLGMRERAPRPGDDGGDQLGDDDLRVRSQFVQRRPQGT
jgi:hypothetical protein